MHEQITYHAEVFEEFPIGTVVVNPMYGTAHEKQEIKQVLGNRWGKFPKEAVMGHVIGYAHNDCGECILKVKLFDTMTAGGSVDYKEGEVKRIHYANVVKVS